MTALRSAASDTIAALVFVFRSPASALVAAFVAAVAMAFAIWSPNLGLVTRVALASDLSPGSRLAFLWASLGALTTSFSTGEAAVTALIAILVGLNAAVWLRLVRRADRAGVGLGSAGLVAGVLGLGCSACGVGVLAVVLGPAASATAVALLPLGGPQAGLLGAAPLLLALAVTASPATRAGLCPSAPAASAAR